MRVIVTSIFIAAAGLASPVGAVGSGSGGNSAVAPVSARIAKAERMIKSGNHVAAVETLRVIVEDEPGNADAWNLLGFASRKLKRFDDAEAAYETALRLDPEHLGALEYQGELFIETDRMERAKANLARLNTLCGVCLEFRELRDAIRAAAGS